MDSSNSYHRLLVGRHLVAVVLVFLIRASEAQDPVKIGDECGVNGADFLDDSFTGTYRVSGDAGCTIGEETGCYCSPILGDADPLGEWIWQCTSESPDAVPFGPADGKICPAEMPVPLGFLEDVNPSCNSSNPTGQAGDPPCSYSDCDSGGNLTAVCGCVDLTFGQGPDEEGDLQWFCLHSTCECGAVPAPEPTDGASAMSSFAIFSVAAIAAYALL